MNKKSYLFKILGFGIGASVFIYTVISFGGFKAVLGHLLQVKYYYVLVVLNSLIWMLLYTEGWHKLFAGLKHKLRFLALFKIKLSGEGINFMTPMGFIAGDPIRVLLLRKFVGPEARLGSR